ncbi:hypothetical protein F441_22227, partial [Phytophthora nicotianae CJ01A1]
MTFKSCWRELKRDGWTSKPPVGLSNDFFYIKPGKTKKGVRGEDFFLGEKELMDHLDRLALGRMRQKQKDRDVYGRTIAAQNEPVHDGSASGEHRVGPSEAAVEGSTTSPAVTPEHTSLGERLIPTSPHVMASDEESESCSQNGTPVPDDSEVQRNLEADFEGVVNAGDGGDAGRDIQANQGTLATHRPQPIDEETKETEPPGNTPNT